MPTTQMTLDFMSPELTSQFAALAARGGSRNEAFQLFLTALKEAGVSEATIDEAAAIGPKLLKKAQPTKALKALAGGLGASEALDKVFAVAKTGMEGIPDNILITQWRTALAELGRTNKALATRLKTVPKAIVAKVIRSGTFAGGPGTGAYAGAVLPGKELAVARPGGGPLATVAKGAEEAAPVAAKVGSKLGGLMKAAGWGIGLNLLLPFGSASPVTLPFRQTKARNRAVEGFAAMGATSSAEVMKAIVRQQELASRRQMTLQTFEPEMFQRILAALATTDGPSPSVTDTERTIGAVYEQPLPARRPDKDVRFLLDQLMQEMSGPL